METEADKIKRETGHYPKEFKNAIERIKSVTCSVCSATLQDGRCESCNYETKNESAPTAENLLKKADNVGKSVADRRERKS